MALTGNFTQCLLPVDYSDQKTSVFGRTGDNAAHRHQALGSLQIRSLEFCPQETGGGAAGASTASPQGSGRRKLAAARSAWMQFACAGAKNSHWSHSGNQDPGACCHM